MSLLSSIFGKGPAKEDDGKGGLFSSAVIPKVLHSKKAAPSKAGVSKGETKSKKAKNKCDDVGEQNVEKSDGSDDDASSEGSKKEVQDDGAEAAIVQADDDTKGKLKQTEEERLEEERRTIFVGNLPPDISRRALAGIFKPCGTVTSARLRSMAVAGVKLPPDQAGNQVSKETAVYSPCILVGTLLRSSNIVFVHSTVESDAQSMCQHRQTPQR